jgi:bifunctional DNA-binding transcriptional regulator/antitoxin component of YhaV-PrlF toxin-antitoxin module
MLPKTITIDSAGRITLPQPILEALGVSASYEAEVVVELTENGVILKPKDSAAPLTERIATMNLPVASWEQMKQEIEAG